MNEDLSFLCIGWNIWANGLSLRRNAIFEMARCGVTLVAGHNGDQAVTDGLRYFGNNCEECLQDTIKGTKKPCLEINF